MLYSDNRQHLVITDIKNDCKISHRNNYVTVEVDGESNTESSETSTRISIAIHKDILIELVSELCRPYIKEDLACQAERGNQYRVIKISTSASPSNSSASQSTNPGAQGAVDIPEQLIRDILSGLA